MKNVISFRLTVCTIDFAGVLLVLFRQCRVIIHDHPGFGLSEKPGDYSYSLIEQAETALTLWRELGLCRVHLLGHDYGTSVATEILARRRIEKLPVEIDSLTLCNGSMHIFYSGQKPPDFFNTSTYFRTPSSRLVKGLS